MRFQRRLIWPIAIAFSLMLATLGRAQQADPPDEVPLDIGLTEEVGVRMVLVDFIVLDREDRTVGDLKLEDFVIVTGGRERPLSSLDLDCPGGEADEPLPGAKSQPLPDAQTTQPRRIVLVLDYFHITNLAETFEHLYEMLDKWPVGGEQHMLVSLGEVVRIEAPFTDDPDDIRWALERMRRDPELYAGEFGRLTERRFFDRIENLFDILERWESRKSLVLFSGPFLADGFTHDPEFKRLSALSTATRTAIYPVDTGGLRTDRDPYVGDFMGPPALRRLANETGGRMTFGTNEIGLAYAKAHRDLSCTYTLGFQVPAAELDRKRRLTIRLLDRPGLRIVYPEFYVLRSPEEKRKSLVRSATMTPHMFDSERMSIDLFLLQPESASRWSATLAVEARLAEDSVVDSDQRWELKSFIRKRNGTTVQTIKQQVDVPRYIPGQGPPPVVSLRRELRIRPGEYVVNAVLSDPRASSPLAATRPAIVAPIPTETTFLVGPILGRRIKAGARADGLTFEPALTLRMPAGAPLDARTAICRVGPEAAFELTLLQRRIVANDGATAIELPAIDVQIDGDGKLQCHTAIDRIETAGLPAGDYTFSVLAAIESLVLGRGRSDFHIEHE